MKPQIIRQCDWCNTEYTTTSKISKYCSTRCKKRAYLSKTNPSISIIPIQTFIHKCIYCGNSFESKTKSSKYCSSRCQYRYTENLKRGKTFEPFSEIRKCLCCGNLIQNKNPKVKYCSSKCKKKNHLINKKGGKSKIKEKTQIIKCVQCGKEFLTSNNHKKYCGETCKQKYLRHQKRLVEKKYCRWCSNEILPKFGINGGHFKYFCSKECSNKFHHKKRSPQNEIAIRIDKNTIVYTKEFDRVDEIRKKHLDALEKQKINNNQFASELYNPYLFRINFNE